MPKGIKKQDLPEKTCPVCERPFIWRKKWAKNWENVIYCSQRCRNRRPQAEKRAVRS
jgi:hypothetical protein